MWQLPIAALGFCLHCIQHFPSTRHTGHLAPTAFLPHRTALLPPQAAASWRVHHFCFSFWKGNWVSVDRATIPPTQCCLSQGLVHLYCCGQTCLIYSQYLTSAPSHWSLQHFPRKIKPSFNAYYSLLWRHWCTEQSRQSKEDTLSFQSMPIILPYRKEAKVSGLECAHYFSFPATELQEICAKKC